MYRLLLTAILAWLVLAPALAAPPTREVPQGMVAHPMETLRAARRPGGPGRDGIPSIDRPRFVSADQARLDDDDIVIGLYHRGEARAYPQRILVWHEIVNDEVGGESLSITYCPLTATALGFRRGETELGVSGKLVNSNLVMYDRATGSEWPQILGAAIDGPLAGQGLEEVRVVWTTWGQWRARYPESEVLSERTGYVRNYRRDPYGSYNPLAGYYLPQGRRLFPVLHRDDRLPPKTLIYGVRTASGALAVDRRVLRDAGLIETRLGAERIVVIHDPGLDSAWAFRNPRGTSLDADTLGFGPEGVSGPGIEALEPLNGFEAMWFAWVAFYPATEFYAEAP